MTGRQFSFLLISIGFYLTVAVFTVATSPPRSLAHDSETSSTATTEITTRVLAGN